MKSHAKRRSKKKSFLKMAKVYVTSYFDSLKSKSIFQDIQTYCMFVGYPRSGHSLVGALIDAHPNAIISNELDALWYLRMGFSKAQLYTMIFNRSAAFAKKGRKGDDYTYFVPNQWHGRFQKLLVIGDKKGAGSSSKFKANPKLLNTLQNKIDNMIKFIHVTRNPYDTITTMSKRTKKDIETSMRRYFLQCEVVMDIKKKIDASALLDMRHEDIIAHPRESIRKLCLFLGLEPQEDYIDDCASIIYTKPHQSRYEFPWTDEMIELVAKKMREFSFLDGYSFIVE